jgi:O-methyltransferase
MLSRLERKVTAAVQRLRNRSWFLSRATSPADRRRREWLLQRFRLIERRVHCAHAELELLHMADYLLRAAVEGDLIECGCYLGGSSAKLSLVAAALGRTLWVCDSFQGLPPVAEADGRYHSTWGGRLVTYQQGEFAARLDVVRGHVERFGDASVCRFVPGFFSDTLPGLKVAPAFAFMDVDLIASGRDCLRALWPRLRPDGRFYTHEANLEEFIHGIMDPAFWIREIGQGPPPIFGAGYGCGFGAGQLAYLDKRPGGRQ